MTLGGKISKEHLQEFRIAYLDLCSKYGVVFVPSYEGKPSAHDPLILVELDDFWVKYALSSRLLVDMSN